MAAQHVVLGARVAWWVPCVAFLSVGCVEHSSSRLIATDGGIADGTSPAPPEKDAAVVDVADALSEAPSVDSASDAGGGGCHPIDVSGFRPTPRSVTHAVSSACSGFEDDGGLVQSYATACLRSADTYSDCATFSVGQDASAERCLECIRPADGGSAGVVATLGHVVFVDYGSCIQALDPTDAGASCAQAIAASAQCALYACASVCPVIDGASRDAFLACTDEAQSGGCASYALAAAFCTIGEQGDGAAAVDKDCLVGVSIEGNFFSFEHYLCGGP